MAVKTRIVALSSLGILGTLLLLGAWELSRGRAAWLYDLLLSSNIPCDKPDPFGSFHLVWLSLCVLLSLLLGIWGNRRGKHVTDTAVLCAGGVLLLLEAYKQLYSFFVLNGQQYDFSIFPFQFCSLPLYLYWIVPFLREGRLKETLYQFLAFFGTMGGCLVMAYPRFYDSLALSVHTMLWHTVMIAAGVLILFSRGYGRSWVREVLPSSTVFLISVAVATVLNVTLRPLALTSPNPLNLFYMSPYENTYFLLIRDVQASLGWLPSLICYMLLFIFVGATLVFGVARLIRLAEKVFQTKRQLKKEKN